MGNCSKREAGPKGDFVGGKPNAAQGQPAQPKTEQEIWIAQREAEQDAELARARDQRTMVTAAPAGQPGTFQIQRTDGQQGGMFCITADPAVQAASPEAGGPQGHVAIRGLTGETFVLPFTSDETVITLKRKLQILSGLHAQKLRLIFEGRQLENDRTLGDYNVQNESLIRYVQGL